MLFRSDNVRSEVASIEVEIKQVTPMIIVVGSEIKNNGDEGANIDDGVGERHWCGKKRGSWRIEGRSKRILGRGRCVCRGGGFGDVGGAALEVARRRQRWWGGRRSHTLGPKN